VQLRARKESILSSVDFNQKEFSRFSKLTEQGATTKQKLDEVANNLRNARAELGQIDAQMNAQQASINTNSQKCGNTSMN
jgi:multidrug resistance efflux pump